MKLNRKPFYRSIAPVALALVTLIPQRTLLNLLSTAAKLKALSLSPADGLRLLFGLDALLYPLQGQLSVAYGGGSHTKHRHINYLGFFVGKIRKGERVLDVGCSTGDVAAGIARIAKANVTGIDIDAERITEAARRPNHPLIKFCVGDDLEELPEGKFDVAVL